VGAAIAAGSQLLNGKKADLVIEPSRIKKIIKYSTLKHSTSKKMKLGVKSKREKEELMSMTEISSKKILSPRRLVKRVSKAE